MPVLVPTKDILTTPALDDWMHVVDVSDTTSSAEGTSKRATINAILAAAGSSFFDADIPAPIPNITGTTGTGAYYIPFTRVNKNVGNNYTGGTGIYLTPVDGRYGFATTAIINTLADAGINVGQITIEVTEPASSPYTVQGVLENVKVTATPVATVLLGGGVSLDKWLPANTEVRVYVWVEGAAADSVGITQNCVFGGGLLATTAVVPTLWEIKSEAATSRTLTSADLGTVITLTHASPITLTLPQDATENLPGGFNCTIIQGGAGQIQFASEGSDTISAIDFDPQATPVKTRKISGSVTIVKRGSGDWFLIGNLTE